MVLGLDYNGVLTKRPDLFRKLAKNFDRVVVVSVTKEPENVRMSVKRLMVDWKVVAEPFVRHKDIPAQKLDACRRHHINVFIDDIPEVCTLLNRNNILALQYKGNYTHDY